LKINRPEEVSGGRCGWDEDRKFAKPNARRYLVG
jgi:hypothetical protein